MSNRSLRTIRSKMPDSLPAVQVSAALDEVFAAEDSGAELSADVAATLFEVMVRAAENIDWLSDSDEARILDWVARKWTFRDPGLFRILGTIAVNLKSEDARRFLEDRSSETSDPVQRERLQSLLSQRQQSEAREADE